MKSISVDYQIKERFLCCGRFSFKKVTCYKILLNHPDTNKIGKIITLVKVFWGSQDREEDRDEENDLSERLLAVAVVGDPVAAGDVVVVVVAAAVADIVVAFVF